MIAFIIPISVLAVGGLIWFHRQKKLYKQIANIDYKKELGYSHNKYRLIKITELPKFSFEQFQSFYILNPSSWELTTDNGLFIPAKIERVKHGYDIFDHKDYYSISVVYPIFFKTWWDFFKYKRWAKKELKQTAENQLNSKIAENTTAIIQLIQKDIDAIQEESNKVIEEETNTLVSVLKDLNNHSKETNEVRKSSK